MRILRSFALVLPLVTFACGSSDAPASGLTGTIDGQPFVARAAYAFIETSPAAHPVQRVVVTETAPDVDGGSSCAEESTATRGVQSRCSTQPSTGPR